MRFRLLRRRLTISAPRMAVRSALPWPFRWLMLALMLGLCAAVALWAFEFGKSIAGLDIGTQDELVKTQAEVVRLRAELLALKDERDKAQSIANTSATLLTTEKAAQLSLLAQNRQMEADNRALRDGLGFFEKLIPAAGGEGGISIRGLQAEVLHGTQIKWQVMVMQSRKEAAEFNGRLELSFSGVINGKPWVATLPDGPQDLKIRHYGRIEGMVDLPPQAVVKVVSAKVMEGTQTRATQSIKL